MRQQALHRPSNAQTRLRPIRHRFFRAIDLFCGAGGLTLGFTKAFGRHFQPVWANDFDPDCVKSYNANFGDHCVPGDLTEILKRIPNEIPTADVVIGGPPCQGKRDCKKHSGEGQKTSQSTAEGGLFSPEAFIFRSTARARRARLKERP